MEPKSLIQIVSEEEFLPIAQETCGRFFKSFNLFVSRLEKNKEITRNFYSNIVQEAEFLECFLDEHGARENKRWSFFTEYVASIRNLGIAGFYLRHLFDRYPHYNLREPDEIQQKFISEASDTLAFINKSIHNLYQGVIATGKINGLSVTGELAQQNESPDMESNKRLPRNISEEEVKNEEERIIDLCEKIQNVAKRLSEIKLDWTDDLLLLKQIIPGKIDETKARMFMNLIHNVQSDFDTYIKNTRLEHDHSTLKYIRGNISVPLHLFEFVLWLCHFYERHEDEIRHGECKRNISKMVDKNELLDRIVNFGFFYGLHFVKEGKKIADEILEQFVQTIRVELPIPQPLGFHARPSTYISLIAREHGGEAFLIVDGERFNAKSVMSLLQAGGAVADKGYGTVIFEGDKRVIEDIKILANNNYCEENKIPPKLSYLREIKSSA